MHTTDSFTRCWKRPAEGLVRWAGALLLGLAALVALPAWGNATVTAAKLELTDEGYQLNADVELQLAPALFEAVRKGVPLYFQAEFELTRGRWYWFDQRIASAQRERRLSFAPLTDQYRVVTSGISQTLSSAEDVARVLSRIRSWTVAERGQLKAGERYEAALRFRLDSSQLPKPFQLSVLTAREWTVNTDWHRWTVSP